MSNCCGGTRFDGTSSSNDFTGTITADDIKTDSICDKTGTSCINLTSTDIDLVATNILVNGAPISGLSQNQLSTGIVSGMVVTVNGANPLTEYDVSAGTGQIFFNGVFTDVNFAGVTGMAVTAGIQNAVYVDATASIFSNTIATTPTLRRQRILCASIGLVSNQIATIQNDPANLDNTLQSLVDLSRGLGIFNLEAGGNVITANGANLQINKSAGKLFQMHIAVDTAPNDPNTNVTPVLVAPNIFRLTQTGPTGTVNAFLDTANYDVGGVVTALPGGSNVFGTIRIYITSGNLVLFEYPQTTYNSLSSAVDGISSETHISVLAAGTLLRAFVTFKKNTADLTLSENFIQQASRFGDIGVVASSTSLVTMQQTYNNSTSPEIVTDAVRGAVQIQNGTASDANPVFQILDTVGDVIYDFESSTNIKLGKGAGSVSTGPVSVCIGLNAGRTSGIFGVFIGSSAGDTAGNGCVAIGPSAGSTNMGNDCVAIGSNAGNANQNVNCVAIGSNAGNANQNVNCVAIGIEAGTTSQGAQSVAIGRGAGNDTQLANAVAIGNLAANLDQGIYGVAIGSGAATTTQGTHGIAIGRNAGTTTQGAQSIAIGYDSGNASQLSNAVAIGYSAGKTNQGVSAIAIGIDAGLTNQATDSICIGNTTIATGVNSIAIGKSASTAAFTNSIALGNAAVATANNQMMIGSTTGGTTITTVVPGITATTDLGSTSRKFNDLHLAGGVNAVTPIVLDTGSAGVTAAFSTPSGDPGIIFSNSGTGNYSRFDMSNLSNATPASRHILFNYNGVGGGVQLFHGATAWTAVSDEKLKEDIVPISDCCSKLSTIKGYKYKLKADPEKNTRIGILAQEIQTQFPEVIDTFTDSEGVETLGVRYTELIPVLIGSINELMKRINILENK